MFENRLGLFIKFCFQYYYYRLEQFIEEISKTYDRKGKKLLDIGARSSPFKRYFKNVTFKSLDLTQNKNKTIDYIADINKGIPQIPHESFDYLLCTQVLEHIKRPEIAFAEFNRILKKSGRLFLATNFFYPIHMAPNDYFRFTKYGLRYLGESHGFIVEHLEAQGGIFHTISYLLVNIPIRLGLKHTSLWLYLYFILFSVPIIILNLMALVLDQFDRDREVTINYEVIYRKKKNIY